MATGQYYTGKPQETTPKTYKEMIDAAEGENARERELIQKAKLFIEKNPEFEAFREFMAGRPY